MSASFASSDALASLNHWYFRKSADGSNSSWATWTPFPSHLATLPTTTTAQNRTATVKKIFILGIASLLYLMRRAPVWFQVRSWLLNRELLPRKLGSTNPAEPTARTPQVQHHAGSA